MLKATTINTVEVNRKEIAVTEELYKMVKYFNSRIEDKHNGGSFKFMGDRELLDLCESYTKSHTIVEFNKTMNGIKCEGAFLLENNTPIDCVMEQDNQDISETMMAHLQVNYDAFMKFL